MMLNGHAHAHAHAHAHGGGVGVGAGAGAKGIDDELSLPILLSERVKKAASDAAGTDCASVSKLVHDLSDLLRLFVRRAASIPSLYDRPILRIFAEATKALDRALSFIRRSRHGAVLRRVVTITTGSTDCRKVLAPLEASIGDLKWLLSIYSSHEPTAGGGGGGGIFFSLPPIASTDPILSWVWTDVAVLHMSSSSSDKAEAAASLANLALDSDRNKKVIVEEGAVPALLSLLRDSVADVDACISAATALTNLANYSENVAVMLKDLPVRIIVSVLSDSPMKLQTRVAVLISRMAAHDPVAREEFAEENAIRPLVSLLSFEVPFEDPKPLNSKKHTSIHSIVQGIASSAPGTPQSPSGGSSKKLSHWERSHHSKEKENESPEVKLQLKLACADALWMLSRGCVSNSRKITETKGLLCLSKIIELEKGELQCYCLLTIVEIAAAAEFDADLRRSAFKTNSPAAKSVVDQLLRLVQQGGTPALQIAATRAIGSLARTFPTRETRILSPLVVQLGHWNPDIAAEAAKALGKFASPENYLRVEHSKAMIEFAAVPQILRLLRSGEKTQLPALTLLCYLALNVPKSEALEQSKVLVTLESAARTLVAQNTSIKELLPNAIYQLELYHVGDSSHGKHYAH